VGLRLCLGKFRYFPELFFVDEGRPGESGRASSSGETGSILSKLLIRQAKASVCMPTVSPAQAVTNPAVDRKCTVRNNFLPYLEQAAICPGPGGNVRRERGE